jgi:hypothetical protein
MMHHIVAAQVCRQAATDAKTAAKVFSSRAPRAHPSPLRLSWRFGGMAANDSER